MSEATTAPTGAAAVMASATQAAQATETPAATEQPPAGSWLDNIADSDLKGYVQNKGWKGPEDLALGYRNLEKLLGGEKIPMPKGEDDADGWGQVYDRLGRPKAAEDYQIAAPDGGDPEFAKAAAGKFHELGLSTKQARALADWWNETQGTAGTAAMERFQQQSQLEEQELRREWGAAFDERANLAGRAKEHLGLEDKDVAAIEAGIGTKKLLNMLAKAGEGLREHEFVGERKAGGFGMTPEAAAQQIQALRRDPAFQQRYLSGEADARAEMERLHRLAFPNERRA